MMAGMARRATSRPGFPKMSPMKRIRTSLGPNRNPVLTAAAVFNSRQPHAQLAGTKRGVAAGDVEGAGQTNRPRETSEHALGDMKRRLVVVLARGGPLHAGNHQRVARDDHLHGVGLDPYDVNDDFDAR